MAWISGPRGSAVLLPQIAPPHVGEHVITGGDWVGAGPGAVVGAGTGAGVVAGAGTIDSQFSSSCCIFI